MVAVTFFMRDVCFGGSRFLLGTLVLPGILGMNVAIAMVSMSQLLTADREDGTLLRAKATPNGMVSYLAIFLVPAMLIVPGLVVGSLDAWLTVVWVLVLGLPAGAVLGSVFTSARAQG